MAVPSTMSTDQDLTPQAGDVVLPEEPLPSQTKVSTVTSQNDQRGAENPIASHNDADDLPIRDQEDVHLAEALKKSRMEFERKAYSKPTSYRITDDAIISFSNDFDRLDFPDGDTLLYIGPPPKTKDQSLRAYDYIANHFNKIHRVRSQSLKAMQSSKFDRLLGLASARTERRFRKEGLLKCIDTQNIKYFVDLRPPGEGDEAVVLVTSLSCTRGVLAWYNEHKKYGIERSLVCGADDFSWLPFLADLQRPPLGIDGVDAAVANKNEKGNKPPASDNHHHELQSEYSALRHRSAIERLLQAIEKCDPKIDSAPKMWTYFAVAKYFDCATQERINEWITKWLFTGSNTNFIQNNPDVTYRIGMGIMSPDLTRIAFSILVGEKAMRLVFGEHDSSMLSAQEKSIHGRRLENLDDDERNRIDHAAASLVRRLRAFFSSLVRDGMKWMHMSKEYSKLLSEFPRTSDEERTVKDTISIIQDYVRGKIYTVLCCDFRPDMGPIGLEPGADVLQPRKSPVVYGTYNMLNTPTRLFTHTFWLALQDEDFAVGSSNIWTISTGSDSIFPTFIYRDNNIYLADAMEDLYSSYPTRCIKHITKQSLYDAVRKCDAVMRFKNQKDAAKAASPKRNRKFGDILLPQPEKRLKMADTQTASPRDGGTHTFQAPSISGWVRRKLSAPFKEGGGGALFEMAPLNEMIDPRLIFSNTGPNQNESPGAVDGARASNPLPTNQRARYIWGNQLWNADYSNFNYQPVYGPPQLPPSASGVYQAPSMDDCEEVTDDTQSTETFPLDLDSSGEYFNPNDQDQQTSNRYSGPGPAFDSHHTHGAQMHLYGLAASQEVRPGESQTSRASEIPALDPYEMLREFTGIIRDICETILFPPHLFSGCDRVPTDLIDTLMCLEDDEWKYLPLWAGGNDDGTGGVFDEVDVPNLEAGGFKGGKRGIRSRVATTTKAGDPRATTSISSQSSLSNYECIEESEALSTMGRASRRATDGTETVKSLDGGDANSVSGFMRQDEIWEVIQEMKTENRRKEEASEKKRGKGQQLASANEQEIERNFNGTETGIVTGTSIVHENANDDSDNNNDDNDVSTIVMGGAAGSPSFSSVYDTYYNNDDDDINLPSDDNVIINDDNEEDEEVDVDGGDGGNDDDDFEDINMDMYMNMDTATDTDTDTDTDTGRWNRGSLLNRAS